MSGSTIWPDGNQCAVVVTVNFDGESVEQQVKPGEPLWGRYSYGRYGAQAGIQRILDLLDRYGVRATFFIPAWDADRRYPDVMERIARAGHEAAGHGYIHESFNELSIEEQAGVLEKSEAIFERVFGQKPAGWRAPDGLMTNETRPLLASRGYAYDSSFCDDDVPYLATGDGNEIVELPVFETASDRYYYRLRRSPEVAARGWREEFSAVYEVGGLFNLTLHPRGDIGSGRAVRIRAVESLLQTIAGSPRIWSTTCGELAAWALGDGRDRLESWSG